jgi:hypothetical protein
MGEFSYTNSKEQREKERRRGREINKLYRDSEMYEEIKGRIKGKCKKRTR